MDIQSFRSLAKDLVRYQLATKEQIQSCLTGIKKGDNMGIDLLDALQKRDILTPYQVERIKQLDFSGVVLGGNKLLYMNSSGSFARVYRASDPDSNIIAVKVLRNRWATDEETVSLFRKEAEMGKKLKHPNIVPIYNIGHEGEHHFFTMEFVEGGTLKDFIKIRKKLAASEACKIIFELASGLEYALKQGCTHRDLKTSNVLMSSKGVARLIDFGLAVDETKFKNIEDERFQVAVEYSTLEKHTAAPKNDPRSDLFFLGTIFYELLTGKPPYPPSREQSERKQATRYSNIRSLTIAYPDLPRPVTYMVDRLLSFNPANRYQTAGELILDLNRFLEANPVVSLHGSPPDSKPDFPIEGSVEKQPHVMLIEPRESSAQLIEQYLTSRSFQVTTFTKLDDAIANMFLDTPDCLVLSGEAYENKLPDVFKRTRDVALNGHSHLVLILRPKQVSLIPESDLKHERISHLVHPFQLRELRKEISRHLDAK